MLFYKEIHEEEKLLKNSIFFALHLVKDMKEEIEIILKKRIGISINLRKKKIDYIEYNNDTYGLITIFSKCRKGKVVFNEISQKTIRDSINKAVQISKYTSIDIFASLPKKDLLAFFPQEVEIFYLWDFNKKKIIELLLRTEAASFSFDKRIVNTEGSIFTGFIDIKCIGNSRGLVQGYKSTQFFLFNNSIAQCNRSVMQSDCSYSLVRDIRDLKSPEKIGKESAKKAILRLFPKKISTTRLPIIFSTEVTDSFWKNLVLAITGERIYKKTSFLLNCMEKLIFPKWLSIVEFPHLKKGLSSKPFDEEGVETKKKMIIQNGKLKTWLLDTYSSNILKMNSTGNSGGIYNWKIFGSSSTSLVELIKYMYKGLLVTELMGDGVNLVSGDYSIGASGFWIEKGEIQYPVSELTIAGNLKKVWKEIIKIGNDSRKENKILSGSILLESMQISGI